MLRFKAGRRERSWVRNCVAVGLASGFLEPLESTSIYLIQAAITSLLELFPEPEISPADRDEFNRLIDLEYDRIRDFLILHYHATERADTPFWDYVPHDAGAGHACWKRWSCSAGAAASSKYREGVFLDASWIAVYIGQRVIPEGYDLRADAARPLRRWRGRWQRSAMKIRATAEAMPDHRRATSTIIARWRLRGRVSASPVTRSSSAVGAASPAGRRRRRSRSASMRSR